MNGENKIDYIEIPAKDPKKAWTFFEGLFGWRFEDYGPDYCSFNDGRIAGGFYRSTAAASVANGAPLIVFYRQDLVEAVKRVKSHGGTITKEIFSFPGGSRFHFTDPNGNEFAIWSELAK
jgi:predicted enzyme related to lactoylglutathione lyase